MVIDDEQGARTLRICGQVTGMFVNFPPGPAFVSVLKKGDPGCSCRNHGLGRVNPEQLLIQDQADPFCLTSADCCTSP
jgi:hypothetical protein